MWVGWVEVGCGQCRVVYKVAFVVEDSQAWWLLRCGFDGGIASASVLEVAEREIAQEPNTGGPARGGLCAKVDRGGEEVRMEDGGGDGC